MAARRSRTSVRGGAGSNRHGIRRGHHNAGLGLIEIMVSAGFAALVLLGFAANTIAVARASTLARNAAAATALAQQQIEALRRLPLDAPGLVSGAYEDPANPLDADGSPGGIFTRGWSVSAPDTPGLGLKTVTVSVSWADYGAHQTTVGAYVRCSTVPCP